MYQLVKNILSLGFCISLLSVCLVQSGWAADKQVTIGYQLMDNPWKVAISDKAFEKATGYDIKWVQFSSGSQASRGLGSGAVDITSIGSVPLTSTVSNGVNAQLFWILEGIGANEQLVVQKGAGIKKMSDLAGKRIGVPVGSTSDLDLFYALKNAKVNAHVLDMQPDAIAAAWHRKDIDGAFVWNPALAAIKKTGHVLDSSENICKKAGICTFDGLAVNTAWANNHKTFMVKFVKVLNAVTKRYKTNTDKWTSDSDMIHKIVKLNGADPKNTPQYMKGYQFLTAKEQLSDKWLGGGAAKSMAVGAKFLKQRGAISKVGDSYDQYVTTKWVKKALDSE